MISKTFECGDTVPADDIVLRFACCNNLHVLVCGRMLGDVGVYDSNISATDDATSEGLWISICS